MSLRTRLLLAFAIIIIIPLALLAFGLRQEMTRRLSQEYQLRVDGVVQVIRDDLSRESAATADRLAAVERALRDDNRFRLAAVAGLESERDYLLDYAGAAMRMTGLSMLQMHDAEGRIISSGHFRNEHGRVDAELPATLANASSPVVLTVVRGVDGEFLALVRAKSFALAGRPFTLVGGVRVDEAFVARLARDPAIRVSLTYPGGSLSAGAKLEGVTSSPDRPDAADVAIGELEIPLLRASAGPQSGPALREDPQSGPALRGGPQAEPAQRETDAGGRIDNANATLRVAQPLSALRTLLRGTDTWLLMTAAGSGIVALALAMWVSSRISRPLAALAEKTAVLDLDRLDVDFDPGRDEVGVLSRLLGDLAARLRTSTARVREAERRATVGDMARQVNHDIKNGLIPLRNVMRHLGQVAADEPGTLPTVLAERSQTIDSSLAYLETLATSYQRLSRPLERRECDLNDLVADLVRAARGHGSVEFNADLAPHVPRVLGDRIAFRRILENLMANAVDSLPSTSGRITVTTQSIDRSDQPSAVRVTVADTGRGMSSEEAGLMFNDFYTTKEDGSGLGLSIVRRLAMDLHGTIAVDSAPGKGTRISIDFPAAGPART